jgi:hypothetical protein
MPGFGQHDREHREGDSWPDEKLREPDHNRDGFTIKQAIIFIVLLTLLLVMAGFVCVGTCFLVLTPDIRVLPV